MKILLAFVGVLGLALALPARGDDIGCIDAFQNVPNICLSNPSGQVYFQHPTDATKFLQCDVNGRMYVIQCPLGEVFVLSSNGCQPSAVQTITTSAVVTPSFLPVLVEISGTNPCSVKGQVYFPVAGDRTKFIECDFLGNPSIMSCPTDLVWEQKVISCIYPYLAYLLGSAEGSTGLGLPVSGTSAQGTSGHGTSGQGTSGQGTSGHGTSGQGTSGQGTSGNGTSGQGTSGQGTSGHGTSDQGTSGQGTSGQGTSGQGTSGHDTSGQGTSGQGTSGHGTLVQGTSGQGTSGNGTSVQGTSGQGTSSHGTSGQGTSGQETSGHGTLVQGTSGQGTSGNGTSVQGTSSQGTSSHGTSGQGTSGQETSGNGASVQGTSGQGTSSHGTSGQGTSGQGTSSHGLAGTVVVNFEGSNASPCTASAIAAGKMYFPHPEPQKFIQCNQWGKPFVMTCPKGYLWNARLVTCYDPFPIVQKP